MTQDKKWTPLFLFFTLVVELALAYLIQASAETFTFYPLGEQAFVQLDDNIWYFFLGWNILVLPLIALSLSRKDGPLAQDMQSRPRGKLLMVIYQYPLGVFFSMGFCMPSLAGDPLGSGLAIGVVAALAPVFLVIVTTVLFGNTFQPLLDALYRWLYHWSGRLLISLSVFVYLATSIAIMVTLKYEVENPVPLILGTFFLAYLPMRIYMLYRGRGTIAGVVLVVLGMAFQQIVLWG